MSLPTAREHRQAEKLKILLKQALERAGVLEVSVLVAVSGGPDSTALLLALVEILGTERVGAAHLNHQLRGSESDADEQFIRDLCQQLGVTLFVERRNIAQIRSQTGGNLEAIARQQRYAWLAELADKQHYFWVATGHTANDQAETVLFRLLRGSGLSGLRGIAFCRPLSRQAHLIRPLLSVPRSAVTAYLHVRGVQARLDSSNLDLSLMRNRIRWQLLPLLQHEYNAHVVLHLAHLADRVREHYAWLEREAKRLLEKIELPRLGEHIVLDANALRRTDSVLLRQALRLIWERENWPMHAMTARHWHRLTEFLCCDGTALELPGGIRVRRRLHTWVFERVQ